MRKVSVSTRLVSIWKATWPLQKTQQSVQFLLMVFHELNGPAEFVTVLDRDTAIMLSLNCVMVDVVVEAEGDCIVALTAETVA